MLGEWFAKTSRRSDIFLATKFMRSDPNTPPGTSGYIREQLEQSLKDLQTGYIDLYYQHRVDGALPIEGLLRIRT